MKRLTIIFTVISILLGKVMFSQEEDMAEFQKSSNGKLCFARFDQNSTLTPFTKSVAPFKIKPKNWS